MTILLSVGLVTAIEISNRLSVNVLLPDMQGNVAASADDNQLGRNPLQPRLSLFLWLLPHG